MDTNWNVVVDARLHEENQRERREGLIQTCVRVDRLRRELEKGLEDLDRIAEVYGSAGRFGTDD